MKHLISLKTNQGIASVEDYQNGRIDIGDVVGVILQTEVIGVVISLDQWNEFWCSERNCKVFDKECGEAEVLQTLSGLELTRNIVNKNKKDGESMTAAMRCWQYKKGALQWYLPSLYELGTIIAYCDELNEVLEMLDADQFDKDDLVWSSSEANSESTWYVYFGSGNFFNGLKYSIHVVRAVSAFSLLQSLTEKEIKKTTMATNKEVEQHYTLPVKKETEKETINIAEILRDYKENEIILYTTMLGNAFFKGFTRDGSGIILESTNTVDIALDANGRMKEVQSGECNVFPSAEMRDWNKFFKHGDVVINQKDGGMFVFHCWANDNYTRMSIIDYFDKPSSFGGNEFRLKRLTVKTKDFQKADEEQRKWFFDLMEQSYTIVVDCGRIVEVYNKAPGFKQYDRVLVRNRKQSWKIDLFSHYEQFGSFHYRTLGGYYEYCIPFDGNEHLVGKEVKDEEE
nr:MAG TPA: Protein of unknown function (DUF1566) [Caudoviricetes sp.]